MTCAGCAAAPCAAAAGAGPGRGPVGRGDDRRGGGGGVVAAVAGRARPAPGERVLAELVGDAGVVHGHAGGAWAGRGAAPVGAGRWRFRSWLRWCCRSSPCRGGPGGCGVLLVVGCGGLAIDRVRALGHRVDGRWLVTRVRRVSSAGATACRPRASSRWTVRQTWFQRRGGVATLVAATAAGTKRYVADRCAGRDWRGRWRPRRSPWVADSQLVRLVSLHGNRWSAFRYRRGAGDLVAADRRCRQDAAGRWRTTRLPGPT